MNTFNKDRLYAENEDLKERIAELELIVEAVAHIGVDFGYGKYELETEHIENARRYFNKGGDL